MPKQYEAIRDNLEAKGKPEKEAKRIAAATYNKHHPNNPVTRSSDSSKHDHTKKMLKGMKGMVGGGKY